MGRPQCPRTSPARVKPHAARSVTRQDGQHAGQVDPELLEVVGEEGRSGLVGNLTVAGEPLGRETDVCLGRGHLPGVAEAEHAAQALLRHSGADLAD